MLKRFLSLWELLESTDTAEESGLRTQDPESPLYYHVLCQATARLGSE